jgi:hypothetical protein
MSRETHPSTRKTRLWRLTSASGRETECLIATIDHGHQQLTIMFCGSVAALEVYRSEDEAVRRGWQLNRALQTKGWSATSDDTT